MLVALFTPQMDGTIEGKGVLNMQWDDEMPCGYVLMAFSNLQHRFKLHMTAPAWWLFLI